MLRTSNVFDLDFVAHKQHIALHVVALVDVVEAAGARHNWSKLRSALAVAVVAVLQFQNRFYESQKLTLYLYINIEVFLGYGNTL